MICLTLCALVLVSVVAVGDSFATTSGTSVTGVPPVVTLPVVTLDVLDTVVLLLAVVLLPEGTVFSPVETSTSGETGGLHPLSEAVAMLPSIAALIIKVQADNSCLRMALFRELTEVGIYGGAV